MATAHLTLTVCVRGVIILRVDEVRVHRNYCVDGKNSKERALKIRPFLPRICLMHKAVLLTEDSFMESIEGKFLYSVPFRDGLGQIYVKRGVYSQKWVVGLELNGWKSVTIK